MSKPSSKPPKKKKEEISKVDEKLEANKRIEAKRALEGKKPKVEAQKGVTPTVMGEAPPKKVEPLPPLVFHDWTMANREYRKLKLSTKLGYLRTGMIILTLVGYLILPFSPTLVTDIAGLVTIVAVASLYAVFSVPYLTTWSYMRQKEAKFYENKKVIFLAAENLEGDSWELNLYNMNAPYEIPLPTKMIEGLGPELKKEFKDVEPDVIDRVVNDFTDPKEPITFWTAESGDYAAGLNAEGQPYITGKKIYLAVKGGSLPNMVETLMPTGFGHRKMDRMKLSVLVTVPYQVDYEDEKTGKIFSFQFPFLLVRNRRIGLIDFLWTDVHEAIIKKMASLPSANKMALELADAKATITWLSKRSEEQQERMYITMVPDVLESIRELGNLSGVERKAGESLEELKKKIEELEKTGGKHTRRLKIFLALLIAAAIGGPIAGLLV